MVVGQIGLLKDRGKLELVRCHLVVACARRYSKTVAFYLEIKHESCHARGDGSEIVVLELLVFGAFMSHERAAGHNEIGARVVERFIHQEVLLFPSEIGIHMFHVLVKVTCHSGGRLVYGVERTQQRGLEVKGLTGIGNEDGGYAKCIVYDEYRR